DLRIELFGRRLLPEALEQEHLPELHALDRAELLLRDDRDRAGRARRRDHLERRLLVESLDPLVDALAARDVDAREAVPSHRIEPCGHEVEALLVEQRRGI